jgi:hypothetical protein
MKTVDLFAGQPERVKALARAGRKQKREKARKDWWKKRGKNEL